jgi:Flp pilus assembly protein TadG
MAMHAFLSIRQRTRAQSMVEFALILPLLVAVLFGIIELGVLLNIYIGVTNSAREAARAGAIYQVNTALVTASDATAADSQRLLYISQVITDTLNPTIDPVTGLTVNVSYSPASPLSTNLYRSGDTVSVQLSHVHQLFFGVLGRNTITIQATSAMRIEQGGTQ